MIEGVDLSRHQGDTIDFPTIRSSGRRFAFLKATEGTGYAYESWFRRHANRARAAGLVLGAYHFLRRGRPDAQLDYYEAVVASTTGGFADVVPIVDVERAADGSYPTYEDVVTFVRHFRARWPSKTMLIYTGSWFWRGYLGNPDGAGLGPLWHSEYDAAPDRATYGGWSPPPLVWQYTSTGRCPGVIGNCDLNRFTGELAELFALAGTPTPPPTPPTPPTKEDTMLVLVKRAGGSPRVLYPFRTGFKTDTDRASLLESARDEGVPVVTWEVTDEQWSLLYPDPE